MDWTDINTKYWNFSSDPKTLQVKQNIDFLEKEFF